MINCEIEPDMSWSKECTMSEIPITPAMVGNPNANPPVLTVAAIQTASAIFRINNVLVATLSRNDNIKF